jgi:hypothetical protein
LRGADLPRAHLEGALLLEAHLERAIFVGARLDYANLHKAFGDERTWLPEGVSRPAHWLPDDPLEGEVPTHIGPVELVFRPITELKQDDTGIVRCPPDFDELMSRAGGVRQYSNSQEWLIERWLLGRVVRELRWRIGASGGPDPGRRAEAHAP